MKKVYLLAIATAAVLVGCSSNDVVNDIPGSKMSREVPIGFNVQKQNITRADTKKLENINHYNFGVWAYKVKDSEEALVMDNYLVGFGGTNVGYEHTNATTWASSVGSKDDHQSPWFYEGLGKSEYTYSGSDGFYKSSQTSYMSKNANQYLRYWDLAYTNTDFYCYAPYNENVTFDKGTKTMVFHATKTIRDGYQEPLNSDYNDFDRALGEYMYASKVRAINSQLQDVDVTFKHMGAQLFIRFYEEIKGYKVEIIELDGDNGTVITDAKSTKGIQAAPAKKSGTTYSKDIYYTTNGGKVTFTENGGFTPSHDGSTTVGTPLMFKIPQTGDKYSTYSVAPGNLTAWAVKDDDNKGYNTTSHNIIAEVGDLDGTTQKYSYSPTIYYPVAQPTNSETGFTFHISYRIIAEDNGEVITVHNATVHVPVKGTVKAGTTDKPATTGGTDYYITAWQPNVKYTYTFKFTKGTTGTTDPTPTIDPTNPTPNTDALFPIVFDNVTIDDYSENFSEYVVSE